MQRLLKRIVNNEEIDKILLQHHKISEKRDIQSLELHVNPFLTDIGFSKSQVSICRCAVSAKKIDKCDTLSQGEGLSLLMEDCSNSSCSTDGRQIDNRNWRCKCSCDSCTEASKRCRHALQGCSAMRCSDTFGCSMGRGGRPQPHFCEGGFYCSFQ